jgi:hypothetical protein
METAYSAIDDGGTRWRGREMGYVMGRFGYRWMRAEPPFANART